MGLVVAGPPRAAVAILHGGGVAVAKQNVLDALADAQFRVIAWHEVGNRPDRVEPRAIKRHPKPHPWLRQPRDEARARLCGQS